MTRRHRNAGRVVLVGWLVVLACLVPGLAQAQTETIEYYGLDAIGSVRIVFNASGAVLGRQDYGPYGRPLFPATGLPPERFGGRPVDAEIDQGDFQAREYQMRTGRFTRVDPIYEGIFEPQRWNRYAYALNNPLVFSDPNGLNACETDYCETVVGHSPDMPLSMRLWFAFGSGSMGGGGSVGGMSTDSGGGWAGINVEAAAQAVLDSYGKPAEIVLNEIKNVDTQNSQCTSGGGIGRIAACASVLAAVAPVPALKVKAVNLPAWRKVTIDIEHIASGHMLGGSRVSPAKTLFPPWMDERNVEAAVRQAYRFAGLVERQGENIRLIGQAGALKIEMWLNTVSNTIRAYPKWWP
jgi:RHS repeat-associated protein